MTSLSLINKKIKADLLALTETRLGNNGLGHLEEHLDKKQYKIFPRFTKAGEKGIALAIKHNTFKTVRDVTNSQLKTILAIRVCSGTTNIRVILGYAPQETDDEAVRVLFFNELELEIKMCVENGDLPIS